MQWILPLPSRVPALTGLALLILALPAAAQRPAPLEPGKIRVCADPDNMPSSNDRLEGYENKLAALIAKDLNSKLEYVWYPTRRGYFRILNGMYCDLAVEVPAPISPQPGTLWVAGAGGADEVEGEESG